MIRVEKIYASGNDDLQEELNKLRGRVISVEYQSDDWWRVIYEENI